MQRSGLWSWISWAILASGEGTLLFLITTEIRLSRDWCIGDCVSTTGFTACGIGCLSPTYLELLIYDIWKVIFWLWGVNCCLSAQDTLIFELRSYPVTLRTLKSLSIYWEQVGTELFQYLFGEVFTFLRDKTNLYYYRCYHMISQLCCTVFSLYMKKTDTLYSCNSDWSSLKIIMYVTFFLSYATF